MALNKPSEVGTTAVTSLSSFVRGAKAQPEVRQIIRGAQEAIEGFGRNRKEERTLAGRDVKQAMTQGKPGQVFQSDQGPNSSERTDKSK